MVVLASKGGKGFEVEEDKIKNIFAISVRCQSPFVHSSSELDVSEFSE